MIAEKTVFVVIIDRAADTCEARSPAKTIDGKANSSTLTA